MGDNRADSCDSRYLGPDRAVAHCGQGRRPGVADHRASTSSKPGARACARAVTRCPVTHRVPVTPVCLPPEVARPLRSPPVRPAARLESSGHYHWGVCFPRRDPIVRSRGDSPAEGDANLMPASVPDIGRSLRLARLRAELTVREAAARGRAWTPRRGRSPREPGPSAPNTTASPPSARCAPTPDSLGLPGDDYVLAAVEQWPSLGHPVLITSGDTAVVPGGLDLLRPRRRALPGRGARLGVARVKPPGCPDATTTGVMDSLRRTSASPTPAGMPAVDTGRVPVVDTGQVPAVQLRGAARCSRS